MPTTFATTGFVVLVTINSYGALSPVDKSVLPPGTSGPIMWNVDQCNFARGKMEHPEKYTCQVFTSAKSTAWTYTPPGNPEGPTGAIAPPPPQENLQQDTSPEHRSDLEPTTKLPRAKDDVQLAGGYYHRSYPLWIWVADDSAVDEMDRPFIEPLVEPAKAVDPTVPTKRVVRRQQSGHRQQPQQFDPIGLIASLFTPRDY
jgi:hypothetical protein